MKIHKILALVLSLAILFTLTACGGTGGGKNNLNVVDLGGREITFVTWGTTLKIYEDPTNETMQTYYLRMKEMEEKFNCKFVFKEMASGEILSTFISGEMADTPIGDVVLMRPGWATSAYNEGLLLDLSKYYDGSLEQFYKPAVNMFKKDDSFYSIAFYDANPAENVLFFNKDRFVDAGIDVDALYETVEKGEWTFDKYLEVAQKAALVKNGTYEIYGGIGTTAGDSLSNFLVPFGAEIMTKNDDGTYASGLKSPEMHDALEMVKKINTSDFIWVKGGNDNYETAGNMFNNGTLAMYINSPIHLTSIKEAAKFQFGVLPFPKKDVKDEYSVSSMVTNIAVSPKSLEKDPETAQAIADIVTYVYAPVGDNKEDTLRRTYSMYTYDEQSVDILIDIALSENFTNYNYIMTGLTSTYNSVCLENINKAIKGESSVDAAIAAVNDAWQTRIDIYNKSITQ